MKDIKFELTSESIINAWGVTLFRIKATVDIKSRGVKKGEKGGFVESTHLSNGDARVSGDAWVSGNAQVSGGAEVSGDAWVSGDARVSGNARVSGGARVSGDAWVFGNTQVSLKKAYTKGYFLYTSDYPIKQTIIDQSKEDDFDSSSDYKNLLVVGDYEITDIDPPVEKPQTINIGGKDYQVTEELTKALENLKETPHNQD